MTPRVLPPYSWQCRDEHRNSRLAGPLAALAAANTVRHEEQQWLRCSARHP
ncbi:MAG TPA: hypothetical protein VIR57_08130 [Chloroflexota bacterium]